MTYLSGLDCLDSSMHLLGPSPGVIIDHHGSGSCETFHFPLRLDLPSSSLFLFIIGPATVDERKKEKKVCDRCSALHT
jgi:hypothetical protein